MRLGRNRLDQSDERNYLARRVEPIVLRAGPSKWGHVFEEAGAVCL